MIDLQNLTFGYPQKPLMFEHLDWQLGTGRIAGLFGKNGAGKTTLLKILCGLRFPAQGHCRVLGHEPARRAPSFLQQVYFLPEEPEESHWRMRSFVKYYAPFYPHFNTQEVYRLVEEFQLSPEERLTDVSYGQRKKFFIAFALATHCPLLIMDEPTNGLDIPSKQQFRKMVAASMTEDRTLLISTHQVLDLETLIDQVVMIDQGRIIFNQTMDEIAENYRFGQDTVSPAAEALYQEEVLGGYHTLTANPSRTPSRVSLELLFNAVMTHPENFDQQAL